MEFLNIDNIDDFIKLLINDNRIDVVRDWHTLGRSDEIIAKHRLNYCTDDELDRIVVDPIMFSSVCRNYTLNESIVDKVFEAYPSTVEQVECIIRNSVGSLKPKHLEKIISNKKLVNKIVSARNSISDDSVIYLFEKGFIQKLGADKMSIIVNRKAMLIDIFTASMRQICIASYIRDFTKEEVEYVVKSIMSCDTALHREGYIRDIMYTQKIPDELLMSILKTWLFSVDDPWFLNMLERQNLDNVFGYILENVDLNKKECIHALLRNPNTSTSVLAPLYENYRDYIINAKSCSLPVLDMHMH